MMCYPNSKADHLKRSVIVWMYLLLLTYSSHAQERIPYTEPSRFIIHHWDTEDGLPANFLTKLAQTKDGYLWIGSFMGITRFDGTEFITYNSSNTDGWNGSDLVNQMCTDTEGTLWFTAGNDYPKEVYTLENHNQQAQVTRPIPQKVMQLFCMEGNKIVATHIGEFTLAENKNNHTIYKAPHLKVGTHFQVNSRNDTLIYTLLDELHYRIRDQHKTYKIPASVFIHSSQNKAKVRTQIAVPRSLESIIISAGQEIFNFSNGQFSKVFHHHDSQDVFLINNNPSVIWSNGQDKVYEYSIEGVREHSFSQSGEDFLHMRYHYQGSNAEYSVWQVSELEFRLLQRDSNNTWKNIGLEEFGAKNFMHFLQTQDDLTWVATDAGLIALQSRKMDIYTRKEGLLDDYIYALLQDASGGIWASTWGDGAQKLSRDNWISFTKNDGLPSDFITYIYEDTDSSILLGTYEGVSTIKNDRISPFFIPQDYGLPSGYNRKIYRDQSGDLWLAIRGVHRIANHAFKSYELGESGVIKDMIERPGGALLTSKRDGIFEYKRTNDKWVEWSEYSNVPVMSLSQSSDSTLWISTHGKGLIRKKDETTFAYTIEHGLHTNSVHYVLDDEVGYLWLGTENGLIRISRSSADSVYYGLADKLDLFVFTTEDGLPASEFISGSNSAVKAQDGKLWFATTKGIAVFDPLNIKFNEIPPSIQVTSLEFQGEYIDSTRAGKLKSGPSNTAIFQFRTNSLIPSRRRKYRYRLSGFEDGWHEVSENRARYTSLSPGTYTFEVYGTNNDVKWSSTPATMSFTILPPFYQAWWFFLLCTTIVLAALWLTYRQFMLRNKLVLAQTRVQLADDLHDDIGSRLVAISQSLNFLSSRQSFGSIELQELERQSGIADALGDELRDHVWLVDANQDALTHLIGRMEQFLSSISGPIMTNFQAPPSTPIKTISPLWRRNVYFAYKEAIQNALKHAEATQINVFISVDQGDFFFSVKDNGKGFHPESSSVGRGMSTMKRRTEKIQGKLTIESASNKGTTVSFRGRIA